MKRGYTTIYQSYKSHNVPFRTHLCSEICIVGYGTGALFDLWIRSMIKVEYSLYVELQKTPQECALTCLLWGGTWWQSIVYKETAQDDRTLEWSHMTISVPYTNKLLALNEGGPLLHNVQHTSVSVSSLRSPQSSKPSQVNMDGMQLPVSHLNWLPRQPETEQNIAVASTVPNAGNFKAPYCY